MIFNLVTFILATFTGVFGIYFFLNLKKLKFFYSSGIPYTSPLPIFGNMAPVIFRLQNLSNLIQTDYYLNPSAKYYGFFDFMNPVIVLRDLELIKSIGVKNFDSFPNHGTFINKSSEPFFSRNLFTLTGERWHNTRSLLSPAFTTSKMKTMYTLISHCAVDFTESLVKDLSNNKIKEMKDIFTKYTNDVIATCAFGINVNSMKDPKNDFYVMGREATDLEKITLKIFVIRELPWLAKLMNIQTVPSQCVKFFKNIIESTIALRDEKRISRPDMLQLMMEARGDKNTKIELTIEEMTAQAFVFFFGGFDTTSTNMSFAAYEIALNPEVQTRLQEEIDTVLYESKGSPSFEAINGMEYLDAVFYETMRKWPLAPMLDRVCTKSFELPPTLPNTKPFVVQPGMMVWIPVYAIQRDPDYFDEPEKFNPDRFLSGGSANIKSTTFLSFGIGPRQCIGNRFATLGTKIMLFHLLARCNLKICSETSVPLKMSKRAFSLAAEGGYWLEVEKRNKSYFQNNSLKNVELPKGK